MSLSIECIQALIAALSEKPIGDGELWIARWGDDKDHPNIPANVGMIARDIKNANKSRTILVHGRYGSGKSSFMECICSQIENEAIPLWLDMPSLTSHIDSTALAAVMIRIADVLEEEASSDVLEICGFGQALEDLWRIEAESPYARCLDPCKPVSPPEASRMAGGTLHGDGRRFIKANTLEKRFEKCLEAIAKKSGKRTSLVVFLDDLDRCQKEVAMDVVRLLLRFGSTSNVHFVLACDWDVLEQGVKDWMHQHGKSNDGEPIVTANSALEKYIHTPVELPGMGEYALSSRRGGEKAPGSILKMMQMVGGTVRAGDQADEIYEKPTLADVMVGKLLATLGERDCTEHANQ